MGSEKGIADEAVKAMAGKSRNRWFAILDRWGALEKGHRETAKLLASKYDLPAWWSQTVTVRHELERGARGKGQRGKFFELSVTRTVDANRTKTSRTSVDQSEQSVWFTTRAHADLRVGGRYRNADHDQGEFHLIERPKRIRFTSENPKHATGTIVTCDRVGVGRSIRSSRMSRPVDGSRSADGSGRNA